MEFIESPIFTKDIVRMLSANGYHELQLALIENPLLGVVIPEGRGLRKLRWSVGDKGKRGGLRVIYYYLTKDEKIYFITVYKKSVKEDLSKDHLHRLADLVKEYIS